MSNAAGRINFRFAPTSTDDERVRIVDEVNLRFAGLEGEACVTDRYARLHPDAPYAVCLTGHEDRVSVMKYLRHLPGIDPDSVVFHASEAE